MPKIIYASLAIRPDEISPDFMVELGNDALETIGHVTASLNITDLEGAAVRVDAEVFSDLNDEDTFFNAGVIRRGPNLSRSSSVSAFYSM